MTDTLKASHLLNLDQFAQNLSDALELDTRAYQQDHRRIEKKRYSGKLYTFNRGQIFISASNAKGVHMIEIKERLAKQRFFSKETCHVTRFARYGDSLTILDLGRQSPSYMPRRMAQYNEHMMTTRVFKDGKGNYVGSVEYCEKKKDSLTSPGNLTDSDLEINVLKINQGVSGVSLASTVQIRSFPDITP